MGSSERRILMDRKQLNRIAGLLLTIGGSLLAIVGVETRLRERFPLPERLFVTFLLIGCAFTGAGLLLLFLPIHTVHDTWRWLFGKAVYEPHAARREDLEHIHAFGIEEFGEVSPLESMKQWHKINRNMFHVMKCVRRGKLIRREKLIGFYSVIPLKRPAISLLEADSFDGANITNNLIVSERKGQRVEKPACIYIGSIAARGTAYARGMLVGELRGRLQAENELGVHLIYSRPVTQRGLDLLLQNNFEPVKPNLRDPLKHIYKRELSIE